MHNSSVHFDETDALVDNRSATSATGVEVRLLSTLLNEMDGVGKLASFYQSAARNAKPSEQEDIGEGLMRNDCGRRTWKMQTPISGKKQTL